jgi:hypothetical protein
VESGYGFFDEELFAILEKTKIHAVKIVDAKSRILTSIKSTKTLCPAFADKNFSHFMRVS